MLIGAGGGTGRAIAWQCALENCERLVLVNRTLEKADAIREGCGHFMEPRVLGPAARLEAIAWGESAIRMQLADTDLIVNADSPGDEFERSNPDPSPITRTASHGFRLRIWTIQNCSASRGRTSRRAQRQWNIDVAASRCLSFSFWFDREPPIDGNEGGATVRRLRQLRMLSEFTEWSRAQGASNMGRAAHVGERAGANESNALR